MKMTERTDRELVRQAQMGDSAAIGELFSRYWRMARAAAFGVTGEFASAEDAAAEAFKHAFLGIESLQDPDRFGAWLRTIVLRKARHGGTAADPIENDIPDQAERPDEALLRLELAALVRRASRELPALQREAIALIYFEGYAPEAAANFLDVPAGTLRRRLHDGRAGLRAAIEKLRKGSKKLNESQILRYKAMFENGEIYQALRGSLALRPVPEELISLTRPPRQPIPEGVWQFLQPSQRASDPQHPVGGIVAAIRRALPDFQNWPADSAGAARRFQNQRQAALPPGFAEGHPGSFLRVTRAVVSTNGNKSMYELLQGSPDEQAFRFAAKNLALSDVLDLTWIGPGVIDLHSVQHLLDRLAATVLKGTTRKYSPYDEPRYRAALQLQLGDAPDRAAAGGVLTHFAGHAAHLRLFLEPWASLDSGNTVNPEPIQ